MVKGDVPRCAESNGNCCFSTKAVSSAVVLSCREAAALEARESMSDAHSEEALWEVMRLDWSIYT